MNMEKMMTEKLQGREIILEYQPVGNIMRVSAMDTATMTEVSIQCPVNAGEYVFKKNVLAKMEYVLRKSGVIT